MRLGKKKKCLKVYLKLDKTVSKCKVGLKYSGLQKSGGLQTFLIDG